MGDSSRFTSTVPIRVRGGGVGVGGSVSAGPVREVATFTRNGGEPHTHTHTQAQTPVGSANSTRAQVGPAQMAAASAPAANLTSNRHGPPQYAPNPARGPAGTATAPAAIPPWQHYRGPVAAVHRSSQGPFRPQSSFAATTGGGQRQHHQGQGYNILTGQSFGGSTAIPITSTVAPTSAPTRHWIDHGARPSSGALVVDHASGGSQVYHTADAGSVSSSHPRPASGRTSNRTHQHQHQYHPFYPRSQSVDRVHGAKSARHGHVIPPYATHLSQSMNVPLDRGQIFNPPASSSSLSASAPFPNRLSSSQPSSHLQYANPFHSTSTGDLASTRNLGATLTGSFAPASSSSHPLNDAPSSRPGTSHSDDGASFLEVGVAEDPNPRFRPTMEDAHVVKIGDWVDQEPITNRGMTPQATNRFGMTATTQRRSASYDLTRTMSHHKSHPVHAAKGQQAKSGYFAIYDGHGGREAVDYIERNLHRQLARQLKSGQNPQQALEAAFLETDAQMQATRQYQDSGSTVASALIRPSSTRAGQRDLFVANVGDCLAFGTLVATANGCALPIESLREGDLLLDRRHAPTAITRVAHGVSPMMIDIQYEDGSHMVTPNHRTTLRWLNHPTIQTREDENEHDTVIQIQWTDRATLQVVDKCWRMSSFPSGTTIVDATHLVRSWFDRESARGRIDPLRCGDLFDLRADELIRRMARDQTFKQSVAIPFVGTHTMANKSKKSHTNIRRIEVVHAPTPYVSLSVASADERFVLADGALTHNSRAVVAVGGGGTLRAVRLSKDHTPNDPAEADRVRRAGGAVFRGRVDGQLAVSRAIGDHSLKQSGVSAQPHQQHLPLTKDHRYVIVACDGLWDVMSDTSVENQQLHFKQPAHMLIPTFDSNSS